MNDDRKLRVELSAEFQLSKDPLEPLDLYKTQGNRVYLDGRTAIEAVRDNIRRIAEQAVECLKVTAGDVQLLLKHQRSGDVVTEREVKARLRRIRDLSRQLWEKKRAFEHSEERWTLRIRDTLKTQLERTIDLVRKYLERGTFFATTANAIAYLTSALEQAKYAGVDTRDDEPAINDLLLQLKKIEEKKGA